MLLVSEVSSEMTQPQTLLLLQTPLLLTGVQVCITLVSDYWSSWLSLIYTQFPLRPAGGSPPSQRSANPRVRVRVKEDLCDDGPEPTAIVL